MTCRDRADRASRILFGYLVVSGLINLAGVWLAWHGHSNLWLLHLYTIAEAVLLLWFFTVIIRSFLLRRMIRVLLVLFPVAALINMLFTGHAESFNSYVRSAEALLFIALAVLYWIQDGDPAQGARWVDQPHNWMVSGLLIYFASDFLLFLFSNRMLQQIRTPAGQSAWYAAWILHGAMVILLYLLIAVGFGRMKGAAPAGMNVPSTNYYAGEQ